MAWKKGNKLVFKKEWLTEYPHMKGKRVTFLHCHPQLKSCIVLKIRYGRMVVEEVWHKSYWEKEEIT